MAAAALPFPSRSLDAAEKLKSHVHSTGGAARISWGNSKLDLTPQDKVILSTLCSTQTRKVPPATLETPRHLHDLETALLEIAGMAQAKGRHYRDQCLELMSLIS